MNQKLLCLILFVLLFPHGWDIDFKQKKANGLINWNPLTTVPKGKLKSLKQTSYKVWMELGEITKGEEMSLSQDFYLFDDKGTFEHTYNEKGQIVKEILKSNHPQHIVKYVYDYKKNNELKSGLVIQSHSDTIFVISYTFTKEKLIKTETWRDYKTDTLVSKTINSYNGNNFRQNIIDYSPGGYSSEQTSITFTDNNQVLEESRFNKNNDGFIERNIKIKYNKDGLRESSIITSLTA